MIYANFVTFLSLLLFFMCNHVFQGQKAHNSLRNHQEPHQNHPCDASGDEIDIQQERCDKKQNECHQDCRYYFNVLHSVSL